MAMDKKVAAYLVASLLDRVDQDKIGTASKLERDALGTALTLLSDGNTSIELTKRHQESTPAVVISTNAASSAKLPVNRAASSRAIHSIPRSSVVTCSNRQDWTAGLPCSVTRFYL